MARSELNVALRRADFSAMVGQIVGVKLDIAICGKNAFAVIQPSFSAHGQVALRRNHLPLMVPKAGHL